MNLVRMLLPSEVAKLLRLRPRAFMERRPMLERAGFPRPLPACGSYDPVAIRAWLDAQAGITPESGNGTDPWLATLRSSDASNPLRSGRPRS